LTVRREPDGDRGWLRELGLASTKQLFRDNAIDTEILPELTDSDLEATRLYFWAIAGSCSRRSLRCREVQEPSAKVAAARSRQGDPDRGTAPADSDVHRSGRLDRAVVTPRPRGDARGDGAYQSTAASELVHFDGHVAKFMGDGIVAYSAGQAHEDEAERAVRAALRILDAVGRIATPSHEALAARIGIATGVVVVGDLIGEGAAQEEAVIGDTPNLAARLQSLADPNEVIISEALCAFSAVCSSCVSRALSPPDLPDADIRLDRGPERSWRPDRSRAATRAYR